MESSEGHPPESGGRTGESGAEGSVKLEGMTKKFGNFAAVKDMDLEIANGEFFTMLGPSGCGKTTTLRVIAGFEQPTEGRVLIDDVDVAGLPAYKRPTNTVFQSYALFPHMNLEENVAFGLKRKKVGKAEIKKRVAHELERVGLSREAKRKPAQLSGGQQQRVALARALVNRPKVLLLDEPLGALDLKLRQTMQLELKDIQHEVGITFIYVTHDQEEALTMSDRIGVMNEGRLTQIGGSEEIYAFPSNLFVARFVGEMSFLPGEIAEPGTVRLSGGEIVQAKTSSPQGTSVTLTLRPEMIQLYADRSEAPAGRNAVDGTVARRIFQGDSMFYEVDIGASGAFEVHVENLPSARRWEVGDDVVVDFHPEAAMALAE